MGPLKNLLLTASLLLVAFATAENVAGNVAVVNGVNKFAGSIFLPIARSNPGNVLVSPVGAAIDLAMIAYASGGQTRAQFQRLLRLPRSESAGLSGYRELIRSLENDYKDNEIKPGRKVFISADYPVKRAFTDMLRQDFNAEIQRLNFNKSEESAKKIDAWVQSVAKDHPGHIEPLVKPADLGPNTKIVIVNPIYFRGNWKNGFNPKNTQNLPFRVGNQEKNVPTMIKTANLKYGEMPSRKGTFIVLPFKGDELSMLVFLPKNGTSLEEIEKELPRGNIQTYLGLTRNRLVHVHLPSFKQNIKVELKAPLQSLGLTDVFGPNANLTGISDNGPLYITKLVQHTHVEVDEQGGDIDAGTGDIASRIAVRPVNFIVDRPFHYAIVTNDKAGSKKHTAVTLQDGHVLDPTLDN